MKPLFFLIPLLFATLHAQCLSPVDIHGALAVTGNRVVNENGDPAPMAGNSFFWSNRFWGGDAFYNRATVEYLVEDWNTSIIRAAMGVDEANGFLTFRESNLGHVETLIDLAVENGLYVIVDWHSHHAEDFEQEAIDFFRDIARRYGHLPNVIYEIYNEPLSVSWSDTIKPYAEAVIEVIREEDTDNLIIVGTPFFSQRVDEAVADPITRFDNIAYTIHFYAGTHRGELRQKAQVALDAGIALFCTEWGTVEASGDGAVDAESTREWIEFFEANDISHCNWSVNNKFEGASIFLPTAQTTGGWTDADLTPSGLLVKEIVLDWAIGCSDGEPNLPEIAWVRHFSPPAQGDIAIELEVIEQWPGGFNGALNITNNGAPVDGYELSFTAPWQISDYWNDVVGAQVGNDFEISVFDHEFLSFLGTGATQQIGFTASGNPNEPTDILFNGQPLTAPVDDGQLTLEQWRESFGLSSEAVDSDGDGFDDVLEFFMGTSPDDSANFPSLEVTISPLSDETSEADHVFVQFEVNPLAQNIEYRFETSTELSDWAATVGPAGFEIHSEEELPSGMLQVQWRSTGSIGDLGPQFFSRMAVRQVE